MRLVEAEVLLGLDLESCWASPGHLPRAPCQCPTRAGGLPAIPSPGSSLTAALARREWLLSHWLLLACSRLLMVVSRIGGL